MLLSISGLLLMPRTAEAQTADTLQGSRQALPDRSNTHSAATATDSPSEPAAHAAVVEGAPPYATPQPDSIAAAPAAAADPAAADTTTRRGGFIRRIIDYYSRSNEDLTFRKKIDWSIVPGPNYSSDYGLGIGFMLAGFYRPDRTDSVTSPSNVSIYGNLTTRRYATLYFTGDNYFRHDRRILRYSGSVVYFPGEFYGVGHRAGAEGYKQELTTTDLIFELSYCAALARNFYAGVCGTFNYSGTRYAPSGMTERLERIAADVAAGGAVPDGRMGELYTL